MAFKVFVDDCGQKEYLTPYDRNSVDNPEPYSHFTFDYWLKNYFVLCGVKVDQPNRATIDAEIRQLKQDFFGETTVEVKSNWLRIEKERLRRYIEVYGISPDRLNQFGESFIDLIASHSKELILFGIVVDKRYYAKRSAPENNPLFISTQVLLERIQNSGGQNEVIFDQMEDTKSLSVGNNKNIIDIYTKNLNTKRIYINRYSNISKVSFDHSSGENFLQIADICAYSLYRQVMEHGRIMTGQEPRVAGAGLPMYGYFERIANNFYVSPYPLHNNRVTGYGICIIPNPQNKSLAWIRS